MSQLGTPEHWVATELSSVVKIIDCTLLRILICNVFICSLYFSNLCIFLLSLHLSQFYELVLREINLIDRCVTNFVPRHTGAVKPPEIHPLLQCRTATDEANSSKRYFLTFSKYDVTLLLFKHIVGV